MRWASLASPVMHELYFFREEGPIPPVAASLRERLAEDHNLPGVIPLSLPTIKDAFRRCFPGIAVTDFGMDWSGADLSFHVSFTFNDKQQPTSICISSESALIEDHERQVFESIFGAVREAGCTRIESAIR